MNKELLVKVWIVLLIVIEGLLIYSAFRDILYLSVLFLFQIAFSVAAIYISLSFLKQKIRFSNVLLIFGIAFLMITLIIGISLIGLL
jgi:hypothetical protein